MNLTSYQTAPPCQNNAAAIWVDAQRLILAGRLRQDAHSQQPLKLAPGRRLALLRGDERTSWLVPCSTRLSYLPRARIGQDLNLRPSAAFVMADCQSRVKRTSVMVSAHFGTWFAKIGRLCRGGMDPDARSAEGHPRGRIDFPWLGLSFGRAVGLADVVNARCLAINDHDRTRKRF